MKATELRIGNYVHSNLTKITYQVDVDDIKNINDDPVVAKPIPLTEQWLKDFGFEMYDYGALKDDFQIKLFKYGHTTYHRNTIEMDGAKGNWCYITKIMYVHQLQNLYFALTGEELTKN